MFREWVFHIPDRSWSPVPAASAFRVLSLWHECAPSPCVSALQCLVFLGGKQAYHILLGISKPFFYLSFWLDTLSWKLNVFAFVSVGADHNLLWPKVLNWSLLEDLIRDFFNWILIISLVNRISLGILYRQSICGFGSIFFLATSNNLSGFRITGIFVGLVLKILGWQKKASHCYMWFYICLTSFLFRIKKHIWPNVPDPSKSHIAQWSPHTPPRVR